MRSKKAMRMASMGASAGILALMAVAHPAPAAETAVPGTNGRWTLHRDDDNAFCMVVAEKAAGSAVGFIAYDKWVVLALTDEGWNVPKDAKYTVTLRFDNRRSYTLPMQAMSESFMAAELFEVGVREFRHSQTVVIYNDAGLLVERHSLQGSKLALDYVRGCGRIAANLRDPSRSNPFAQQPASRSNPFD